ncbi:MAG: alkene reductase [Acidobacteria bacterium]|nr:alkene reductase [Acidobacteriota bacterium]
MNGLLFTPYPLGPLTLANRVVMAPMTRNRSIGNVPGPLVAEYYRQRAGAGLIITEGTSPSPHGLGYPRIPGIFSEAQVQGWAGVAEAVHREGGKIFVQLMHSGRIGHPANLPEGGRLLAPSAVAAAGEIWTDTLGMQPHPAPEAMTEADIAEATEEFVRAAVNATRAGLDGVELHAANGYLLEQFFHPASNQRNDAWGGDIPRRGRFLVEVARRCAAAIGGGRLGVRLSPHGVFNDMAPYAEVQEAYAWLARQLHEAGVGYLHLVDHAAMGAPPVPEPTKEAVRKAFPGTLILSGGYDRSRAEADLAAGKGDLVAFGRPFLSNPDLVRRLESGAALAPPDQATFYTPGPAGYTDYPSLGG